MAELKRGWDNHKREGGMEGAMSRVTKSKQRACDKECEAMLIKWQCLPCVPLYRPRKRHATVNVHSTSATRAQHNSTALPSGFFFVFYRPHPNDVLVSTRAGPVQRCDAIVVGHADTGAAVQQRLER